MLHDHCSELIVCSHLRWDWVWQRPQHLISRLGQGSRTIYVEEPRAGATGEPSMRFVDGDPNVTRAWLEVDGPDQWVGFGDPAAADYPSALAEHLRPSGRRIVWLYTAMALPFVDALEPDVVVYDVMDDLASFAMAPPEQKMRHHAALRRADIVFTGGRSLHQGVVALRPNGVHCRPSGVEREHFARALKYRPARRRRPVAGYVGVIDERIDLDLVRDLARDLPHWDIQMVGPVAKIDPEVLPHEPNLSWMGPRSYEELPDVLAGFDVALMPFALNEATRSISPTETLEYLAAGLPVVSTPVPDVVADHASRVDLCDDAAGFAAACQAAVDAPLSARRRPELQRFLDRNSWNAIAAAMARTIRSHVEDSAEATVGSTGHDGADASDSGADRRSPPRVDPPQVVVAARRHVGCALETQLCAEHPAGRRLVDPPQAPW